MNKNGEVLSEVGVSGATSGFVLLEASDGSFSDAVELVVEIGGQEVYAYTPPVSFCDVDGMYRWRNIRQAGGGTCVDTFSPEGNDGPLGRPDGECDGTHLVFLHGYNVNERESRVWARAVFKHLWWAGMESMFTAVAWHGDDGQTTFARHVITPDYQRNVEHAFASASNLAATVNSLPGRKFMMAHSLGNMLVSAARQDHGLQYEKYFMVNAAVPVETYDPVGGVTETSKHDMTPVEWRPYTNSVRATHWYELFLSNPNDERRNLTWKGVFKDVDNTINFYSSMDEVVANGNDEVDDVMTRDFAWYNQEQAKGNLLVSFNPQAGWKFNDHYVKEVFEGFQNGVPRYSYRKYWPDEAALIADTNLMVRPFFKDFRDEQIYGEGGSAFLQANDIVRWYALSHGIPAESFAAGANPVPKWGETRNIDMAIDCNPKAQNVNEGGLDPHEGNTGSKECNWKHSYFMGNSLFDTKKLYEKLVEEINPHKPKKGKNE